MSWYNRIPLVGRLFGAKGLKLSDLSGYDREHWELHLTSAVLDLKGEEWLTTREQVYKFLDSKEYLPKIPHPSYIHDWLEYPEMKEYLESLSG